MEQPSLPCPIVMVRGEYLLDRATEADLAQMIQLLADDDIARSRESPDEGADSGNYLEAFRAIATDPSQLLLVARDTGGAVVGMAQLTLIPGLSRGGAMRLQIESVRVSADHRGSGLGGRMFQWAHDYGRSRGAFMVQLTTDARREQAQSFYLRMGYQPSHIGMKLKL